MATIWRDEDKLIKLVVCGLGLVLTLMLWIASGTLYIRSNVLTVKLKKIDDVYKEYFNAVSRKYVTFMLAHLLPIVFLLGWIVLILRVLKRI